jgi:nucleoside recognition membrane protein YjiH
MNTLDDIQEVPYKYTTSSLLKFILPSFLGVFLFMIPIFSEGNITIPVALLSGGLQSLIEQILPAILLGIMAITFGMTLIAILFKPRWLIQNTFLNRLFVVGPVAFIVRFLAVVFAFLIYTNVGQGTIFEKVTYLVTSEDTGVLVFTSLLPILFSIFLFAGLFLPLLLNFGLLELVGSLLSKIMRPLFKLPGRSAIDCIASWLGDGTIGVLLTSKQYEEGFYSEREACVIGTTFSLVSITFSLVIIDTVGLSRLFVPFYLTVTFASLVAAILVPKFGPLKKKKDVRIDGSPMPPDSLENTHHLFSNGLQLATQKASNQTVFRAVCVDGVKNVIDMWFVVIPTIMTVGTLALIVATFTPIFQILGLPFLPLLYLLRVPEAVTASTTLVAGFADMLLPPLMAVNIQSEMTRFIIACVSVTQLIYLSEVGALLLGSKIPLNIKELFIIFLQRTIITLPIVTLIAHVIF